jgi:hypothetical protein
MGKKERRKMQVQPGPRQSRSRKMKVKTNLGSHHSHKEHSINFTFSSTKLRNSSLILPFFSKFTNENNLNGFKNIIIAKSQCFFSSSQGC